MNRTLIAVGLMAASVVLMGPDIDACGDKSLSNGGIVMQRALAARYPASILIYGQTTSRLPAAARELNLQATLRLVGHKYREVTGISELDAALQSGQFNIVMADWSDLADLQKRIGSAASRVVLIPVAYKLTKAETDAAAKQSKFLIKAPSRSSQYLATITDAVRSRGDLQRKG